MARPAARGWGEGVSDDTYTVLSDEILRLRAEIETLRADNKHLRGEFEKSWPDAERYRWLRCTGAEQQNVLAHYAYSEMDKAIDMARAKQTDE